MASEIKVNTIKDLGGNTVLTSNGSGTISGLPASAISSGTVATARLGSGTASSSTFLAGDSSYKTVSGTTINNNANNKVITGSGTANTLEGEANLIFDGSKLGIGTSTMTRTLNVTDTASGASTGIQLIGANNGTQFINFGDTDDTNVGEINYDHSINKMNFRTNDAYAMVIDGAGIITKPLQPAFMSLNGGGTTLANATDVTITLDTEKFDIGSNISGNTFTAPVTGKYYFSGSVVADAGSGNNTRFSESHIYINCSNRKLKSGEEQHYTNVNDWWAMSVSGLIDMDANDTCTLTYFGRRQSGSGTCVTVGSSTDFRTGLSGYLVA